MAHLKHHRYKELHRKGRTASPSIDAMMREVLHRLGDIDFQYELELDRAELRAPNPDSREHLKRRIRAAHRERREPYVELLATLRQRQHRLAA